ncbi:MAG: VOC family protein [Candidatus Nanopelagicales bacterium]
MTARLAPMLMFTGRAREAIDFYTSLVPDSYVESISEYGPESPEMAGQIVHARFTLGGTTILAMDSPPIHDFTFTPSTSLFYTCANADEVDLLSHALSAGGRILMELGEYDFSPRYAWVADRFGVSWQLFLPPRTLLGKPGHIPLR